MRVASVARSKTGMHRIDGSNCLISVVSMDNEWLSYATPFNPRLLQAVAGR
jgi:hypothetical protein